MCYEASDNTSYFLPEKTRGGGTHSPSPCMEVWDILSWCQTREIILKTRHIPGKFNVITDNLYRPNKVLQTQWSICSTVLGQIFSKWGQSMSDMFATRFKTNSPLLCLQFRTTERGRWMRCLWNGTVCLLTRVHRTD